LSQKTGAECSAWNIRIVGKYLDSKYCITEAQLSHRKGVMPNALWHTYIFGLEVTTACKNYRRVLQLMHGAIS